MPTECQECGELPAECYCKTIQESMSNYFLDYTQMGDDVKVWVQMFFDDGSVTQGKYISRYIYDNEEEIKENAASFLKDTGRVEGVLFIWGAGRTYAKKCELLTLKGSQTLRLRRL